MFNLDNLTEEEKGELDRFILLKEKELPEERKIKNQFIIRKYEDEFGSIPEEYRELFMVCLGEHFENSNHKIKDLHAPYHYNEYNPLCLSKILTYNEVFRYKDIQSYYSCFTPTMTQNEIEEVIKNIFQRQSSNENLKNLSGGLDLETESFLIGMYDILLHSLKNGYEITGSEAISKLKAKYKSEVMDEATLLKPFMKQKRKK